MFFLARTCLRTGFADPPLFGIGRMEILSGPGRMERLDVRSGSRRTYRK